VDPDRGSYEVQRLDVPAGAVVLALPREHRESVPDRAFESTEDEGGIGGHRAPLRRPVATPIGPPGVARMIVWSNHTN
jgi:hypothetical protein